MLGTWVLLFSRNSRVWGNFQHCSAGFLSVHCCLDALMSSAWRFRGFWEGSRKSLIDRRTCSIPPHCLGPLSAEGAGLGLCGPWEKKEVLSIAAELMASHSNNLLLPCTVDLALSPCSLRSPCLPHTCTQLSLGSQRVHEVLQHPLFSLARGSMYHSWIPDLWGGRPHGAVTAEPNCLRSSCFPAPDFHRTHRN